MQNKNKDEIANEKDSKKKEAFTSKANEKSSLANVQKEKSGNA